MEDKSQTIGIRISTDLASQSLSEYLALVSTGEISGMDADRVARPSVGRAVTALLNRALNRKPTHTTPTVGASAAVVAAQTPAPAAAPQEVVKRKGGRPRKYPLPDAAPAAVAPAPQPAPAVAAAPAATGKRGPRKDRQPVVLPDPVLLAPPTSAPTLVDAPVKRKPGRPPKVTSSVPTVAQTAPLAATAVVAPAAPAAVAATPAALHQPKAQRRGWR